MTETTRRGRPTKMAPQSLVRELEKLRQQVSDHETRAAEARAKRDALILKAVRAGGSFETVGNAAGVSNQRVSQLVHGN